MKVNLHPPKDTGGETPLREKSGGENDVSPIIRSQIFGRTKISKFLWRRKTSTQTSLARNNLPNELRVPIQTRAISKYICLPPPFSPSNKNTRTSLSRTIAQRGKNNFVDYKTGMKIRGIERGREQFASNRGTVARITKQIVERKKEKKDRRLNIARRIRSVRLSENCQSQYANASFPRSYGSTYLLRRSTSPRGGEETEEFSFQSKPEVWPNSEQVTGKESRYSHSRLTFQFLSTEGSFERERETVRIANEEQTFNWRS